MILIWMGEFSLNLKKIGKAIAIGAAIGTVLPGPWGVAAGAVSAAAYAAIGDKKAAGEMVLQAALAGVGAGALAKAVKFGKAECKDLTHEIKTLGYKHIRPRSIR